MTAPAASAAGRGPPSCAVHPRSGPHRRADDPRRTAPTAGRDRNRAVARRRPLAQQRVSRGVARDGGHVRGDREGPQKDLPRADLARCCDGRVRVGARAPELERVGERRCEVGVDPAAEAGVLGQREGPLVQGQPRRHAGCLRVDLGECHEPLGLALAVGVPGASVRLGSAPPGVAVSSAIARAGSPASKWARAARSRRV